MILTHLSVPSCLSSLPLIAVAYLEGTLAIYDLSTQVLRHSCQHEVTPSRQFDTFACCIQAQWLDEAFPLPSGGHRSPAVGGVVFCGVHV